MCLHFSLGTQFYASPFFFPDSLAVFSPDKRYFLISLCRLPSFVQVFFAVQSVIQRRWGMDASPLRPLDKSFIHWCLLRVTHTASTEHHRFRLDSLLY